MKRRAIGLITTICLMIGLCLLGGCAIDATPVTLVTGEGTIQSVRLLTEQPTALETVELEALLPTLSGNVFDDDEVSLVMELNGPNDTGLSVIGFYYVPYAYGEDYTITKQEGTPVWRFRFSPPMAGEWSFSVTLSLQGEVKETLAGFSFAVAEATDPRGFLSVEPNNKQTFQFEDGSDYTVIGQNMAWSREDNDYAYYAERMKLLAEGGGNFIRIWLTQWDLSLQIAGREPDDLGGGMYRAATLDAIMALAEQLDIYVEFCVFHHGQFSTIADPVWDGCVYNQQYEGGYLETPRDFFSDERAKEDTKDYLRYLVARYGHSSHIMSWQLFNEADLTEHGMYPLYNWHQEMCEYIRSIDWQEHMVTSSVAGREGVSALKCFDYVCAHWYNYGTVKNLCDMHYSRWQNFERPYFMEEVGNGRLDENLISVHQQNWSGLMSGGPGVAANWFWIECHYIPGYYDTFTPIRDFAVRIPWADPNRVTYPATALGDDSDEVYAVGHSGQNYAYLWVFDNAFTNDTRIQTERASYTVSVPLENGTYTVTWINTWNGETVRTETVRAADDTITLSVPTFTRDIAVAVTQ